MLIDKPMYWVHETRSYLLITTPLKKQKNVASINYKKVDEHFKIVDFAILSFSFGSCLK